MKFRKRSSDLKVIAVLAVLTVATLILTVHLLAQSVTHGVNVTWTASTTSGATYNVYRGTITGGPYTKLNTAAITSLSYLDTTGTASVHYYYVVTATLNGIESVYSNEASAIFPLVPAAPSGVSANPQ